MKAHRGAATLPITLALAFLLLMSVAFASRSLVFEVRSSIHQLRAAQAQEAAQAGLAWALAQLNRTSPIGEDCLANSHSTAASWHQRARLGVLEASCVSQDGRWACHCPETGAARSVNDATTPAFSVQLAPDPERADRWHLHSTGRSGAQGKMAQMQVQIGRLPGLDTVPAAALTARGQANLDARFGAHHNDPASGGLTIVAGGPVQGPGLLSSTPGTPPRASVAAEDTALARLTSHGLHASVFRMDRQAWREQPTVRELDCHSPCDAALVETATRHALISLAGGLRLDAPVTLGTAQNPIVLVVDGPVQLHAGAVIHGLVYTRHAQWTDFAGATIHGAVIAEGDLQAQGSTQIHHNTAVLQALHQRTGTYAPLPGSWRDL